jgi:type III secretory pathway component EscS
MTENKYLKWIMNNSHYLILIMGVINLLKFTIVGLIVSIISVILFLKAKKFREKYKI